jgi:hypothetical protein
MVVELKSPDPTLPVVATVNGPWQQILPDGGLTFSGRRRRRVQHAYLLVNLPELPHQRPESCWLQIITVELGRDPLTQHQQHVTLRRRSRNRAAQRLKRPARTTPQRHLCHCRELRGRGFPLHQLASNPIAAEQL